MKSRPKLLFLGICAGAHEHFLDWCRSGVLPNLQRLVANGLVGRTRNVPAVGVGHRTGSTKRALRNIRPDPERDATEPAEAFALPAVYGADND